LRFNRNTIKAREEERGMDVDVDAALEDMGHGDHKGKRGAAGGGGGDKLVDRRKKRQAMGKLGDEFRAKVCFLFSSHALHRIASPRLFEPYLASDDRESLDHKRDEYE
jgi:hypothetical protein